MDVLILAAGKGTRMKEYTQEKTKAMLPITTSTNLNKQPMLEITVNNCIACGLTRFIIVVGYRKHDIMDHFNHLLKTDAKFEKVVIEYVEQENPSGGT